MKTNASEPLMKCRKRRDDVKTGTKSFMIPMWLTTHREVHTSRRVRVVFDLLAEGLAGADDTPSSVLE